MTEEAAIHQFAKANLKFLTSLEFEKIEYRNRHSTYFFDFHKNRFGRPKSKDIQVELIKLLRQTGVPAAAIVSIIEGAPFFTDIGENTKSELLGLIERKDYASLLPQSEIENVRKVGAYKALEKAKGAEIEERKQLELEEISRKIAAKQQEYDSIPSLLDDDPVEEPEYRPEVEQARPWWERFYLKDDPFPRKDGLSAIATDLYEAVVTRTKPFSDALSGLSRNPDCLFNTGFLLAGGYGYGKTTFIDYLSHVVIYRDIIPIRISCTRSSSDSSGFADSFFLRLRKLLYDEAMRMGPVDRQDLNELELEDQDIELFRKITEKKRGILVFLDDYHKFESHFGQILEFLGTLQILKDSLTRAGLKVGFIVSGLPSWKDQLLRNSQLLGFLDGAPIEMPEITAELVADMFNKRISAFCYEKTPRLIKVDFVQKLVREFEGKVGFRDYITKIVNELSNNNYAIVDSPIEIAADILEAIRSRFDSEAAIGPNLKKLIYGSLFKSFTQQQIAKSLEVVVHIGMQGGIAEIDKEFAENRYYFQVLRECSLIQKQRLGHTNSPKWALSTKLRQVVEEIFAKYRLNLHDYLLKLYAYKGYNSNSRAPMPVVASASFTELVRFFALPDIKLPAGISDSISLGLRLLESLLFAEDSFRTDPAHLQRAKQSLEAFSAALFAVDTSASFFQNAKLETLRMQWQEHPLYDESIGEAFNRVESFEKERSGQQLSLALKQYRDVIYLVANYLRKLIEDVCLRSPGGLLYRPISHCSEAIGIFSEIRDLSYSAMRQDHFRYVRGITDHLELKMRAYFYLLGNLIYGPNYFEQSPKNLVNYAYKNLESRESFVLAENRFNGLTRPQYRTILCESNPLRDEILKHLDLVWKQSDWETFCNVFIEENINSSHIQVDAYDSTQRARYLRYSGMAEELLASMNRITANLVADSTYLLTEKPPNVAESLFRFSLRPDVKTEDGSHLVKDWPKQLTANKNAYDHALHEETFDRIVEQIEHKLTASPNNLLTIDLLDIEYLTGHFRTSVSEFMCTLAFKRYASTDWLMEPWFGSSILIRRRDGVAAGGNG